MVTGGPVGADKVLQDLGRAECARSLCGGGVRDLGTAVRPAFPRLECGAEELGDYAGEGKVRGAEELRGADQGEAASHAAGAQVQTPRMYLKE